MSVQWTDAERADLEETVRTAGEAGNGTLAGFWKDILDGRTPVTDWEDLRVDLYARDGIDVRAA